MRKVIQENWQLAVIIIVGLLARLATSIYMGNQVEVLQGIYDQISYHELALRVAGGHGFTFGEMWWPLTKAGEPTAHWSYLYTFYLVLIYKLIGSAPLAARLIQVLIVGLLHPILIYLLGKHIFNKAVGIVGAALTAFYGYFVYYTASLMTEPFYITAILASLYLAIRLAEIDQKAGQYKYALGLGLTLGVAVLLRQLFLIFVPIILLWIGWARFKRFRRLTFGPLVVTVALICLQILPFTIYNYRRFDRFVLLNTNSGYAFFWSNHPIYGTHFEPILPGRDAVYQRLIPADLRHLDEAAMDQALLKEGFGFVFDDPVRYIQLSISRIPAYFMFWPTAESSAISNIARVVSFGLFLPFMLYGLIYSISQRISVEFIQDPVFMLALFMGVYAVIHLLSWSLIRYRLPVDAVGLIFAAVAIVHLLSKVRIGKLDPSLLHLSD